MPFISVTGLDSLLLTTSECLPKVLQSVVIPHPIFFLWFEMARFTTGLRPTEDPCSSTSSRAALSVFNVSFGSLIFIFRSLDKAVCVQLLKHLLLGVLLNH